jgi:hypothetical protein
MMEESDERAFVVGVIRDKIRICYRILMILLSKKTGFIKDVCLGCMFSAQQAMQLSAC